MPQNTVIVLSRDQEEFESRLKKLHLPGLQIFAPKNEAEILEHIEKANILLCIPAFAKKYINLAKNVTWVQSTFAGIDALNGEDLRKDYVLMNVKETYGVVMAEFVLAYILMFEKEILENIEFQRQSIWQQRPSRTLHGKTVCIFGAGSIGQAMAKALKFFGMRVLGYRTKPDPVENFDEIYTHDHLREFLSQGDYVVSVLPKTHATDYFFNRETFAMMKPSAVFMNVGRGNAVNETDLVDSINKKIIAKAVLDVFQTEPLPTENPLWQTPNVYLTPHLSGYIINDRIFEIFEKNYARFLKGEPLLYQVDFAKGY